MLLPDWTQDGPVAAETMTPVHTQVFCEHIEGALPVSRLLTARRPLPKRKCSVPLVLQPRHPRGHNLLQQKSAWQCTVTITRIQEGNSWWFPSHYNCGKSCSQQSKAYECPKCGGTRTSFRYKLTFYARDETAETEMFCFDTIATQIIGKPCELLLKTLDASQDTPKDLLVVIGLKFMFAVNININSYYSKQRILNVNSVLQAHGRQGQEITSNRIADDRSSFDIDDNTLRSTMEDSPATSMKKLSTSPDTSSVRRSLTYSPGEHSSDSSPKTPRHRGLEVHGDTNPSPSMTSNSDHELPMKRFRSHATQKLHIQDASCKPHKD